MHDRATTDISWVDVTGAKTGVGEHTTVLTWSEQDQELDTTTGPRLRQILMSVAEFNHIKSEGGPSPHHHETMALDRDFLETFLD